ncbi:hypothetical protein MsAg5_14840 [Methanosarcinaceae archaeon Ag5]|uniref:Uncharacterized protein n=1 Tax=Methanolapillus africanus TaxID=3028297 RepID=A0AAE4SDN7_9EURY|nr:hypothetical protein [Methanosarcinaceae archaeon Ag5]
MFKKFLTTILLVAMLISLTTPVFCAPIEKSTSYVDYDKIMDNPDYLRKEILKDFSVSDGTLESFSAFSIWLKKQGVDAEAEGINLIFIDDDLFNLTPEAWIFAATPETKKIIEEKINSAENLDMSPAIDSKDSDKKLYSKEEMQSYLKNFDEKYPTKYINTGLVTYITVENKELLMKDFSEEDELILQQILWIVISPNKEDIKVSNWPSSSPSNIHKDMTAWACDRANDLSRPGINASNASSYISANASWPDYAPPLLDIPFIGPLTDAYEHNYKHYYCPATGFGGAISATEGNLSFNSIINPLTTEQKFNKLGNATHYVADLSTPLHTKYAVTQTIEFKFNDSAPHFTYESYVGDNWYNTSSPNSKNFSKFAKDVRSGYSVVNVERSLENLSMYSYSYADTIWSASLNANTLKNNSSAYYATAFCIDEGQRYLIGVINYGNARI